MSRIRMMVAAAVVSCLGLATFSASAAAQDKKPNVQNPAKGAKETEQTRALQDLELASRLIQYGRKQKHAESLLVAAQILHKTATQTLKVGSKVTGAAKGDAAPPATMDDRPRALVAEAKKLSSSPHVVSLAAATIQVIDEASRGPVGGPRVANFNIQPGQSITFDPITYIGLQRASVHIDNRVFGVMELEVFDEFGNLIARDNIPGTFFSAAWTPAFNGPFTIRLTNRDVIAFNCVLRTN